MRTAASIASAARGALPFDASNGRRGLARAEAGAEDLPAQRQQLVERPVEDRVLERRPFDGSEGVLRRQRVGKGIPVERPSDFPMNGGDENRARLLVLLRGLAMQVGSEGVLIDFGQQLFGRLPKALAAARAARRRRLGLGRRMGGTRIRLRLQGNRREAFGAMQLGAEPGRELPYAGPQQRPVHLGEGGRRQLVGELVQGFVVAELCAGRKEVGPLDWFELAQGRRADPRSPTGLEIEV